MFSSRWIHADQSAWLKPSEAAKCLKKLDVHSVYSMIKESTGKGFFIYKGFIDVFYILHRRERQYQNVHLKLIFLPGAQPI